MMSRSQISLDSELQRRARERATQIGVSFAEYIRTLLLRDLEEPEERADVSTVFSLGSSNEPSDIARNKDAMLGTAVRGLRRRRQG